MAKPSRNGQKTGRDTRFKAGNPGGPGRPKGSKDKLSEAFVASLAADFAKYGVTVVDKAGLTPVQRRVVAEASQTVTESGGTIRVKLHDKLTALDRLGKHLGMFPDKVEGSLKLDATDAFHRIVQYISGQRPGPKLIVPPAADDGPRASAGAEGGPA